MSLVDTFINESFENCTITPMPLFPSGKTITDATGAKLLVYQDIQYDNRIVIDGGDGFKQKMKRTSIGWLLVK